ncbi:thiamine pyrophosphate-binding protein [Polycladomyces subterraneus]|uniref:Thiamine pyrophosphate-binding protein n=1 Tax=Polycladomyces subterraneus TaxID=1016997 RepID=A0ABT8IMN3_9BACL|nr:thiamine pyrophosphate-binding protein [Polycladomyces subterraneus]MDN4594053.1 thiamine pyrophosphate-binding protein [Polycladomyces subterraneus]
MVKMVADYVVSQLAEWGVQRVYGVLGDANLALLDALSRQPKVQYIACRTETAAALMASAEAKLTGNLGVCTATSGPGAALLLAGLGDAALDQVPLLAVTGQVPRERLGTGAKQDLDQQLLFQAVASYSALVAEARGLPLQLHLALRTAVEQGGVGHLSVPKDVWSIPVSDPVFPLPPAKWKPEISARDVRTAAEWLNQSRRPVLLVGRGGERAGQQIAAMAEQLDAPVIATMPARPVIPNDHPLFVGGLGQAGSEPSTVLLNEADVCLVLGATWWPKTEIPRHIPIIQVDADPRAIGRVVPVTVGIAGKVEAVVPALSGQLQQWDRSEWRARVHQLREDWERRLADEVSQSGVPIAPQRVIHALSRCVAEDAVIAVDTGDHTLWFNRIFQSRRQEILISGRWRTLGFALPAAMAAKLFYPDRQVVALAGDGGVMTTIADLVTATHYGLDITLVVMNNGSYAMEKNRMQLAGFSTMGSETVNPDFSALAVACGGEGFVVEQPEDLEPVLQRALARPVPTIVDVRCSDVMVPHTTF